MLEIEKYPCNDKREARKEELRIKLKANMNSYRWFITEEQKKEYYNEYNNENKEKKKQYYSDDKDKIKEYYNDNKDKFKEYYNDNKDKIKIRHKLKFVCPCDGRYTHGDKTKHFKTTKHKNFLEIQNN